MFQRNRKPFLMLAGALYIHMPRTEDKAPTFHGNGHQYESRINFKHGLEFIGEIRESHGDAMLEDRIGM